MVPKLLRGPPRQAVAVLAERPPATRDRHRRGAMVRRGCVPGRQAGTRANPVQDYWRVPLGRAFQRAKLPRNPGSRHAVSWLTVTYVLARSRVIGPNRDRRFGSFRG